MSSGSQKKQVEIRRELARELRQFNGLGASYFRAVAGRIGVTVTDMQVIDILDSTGSATAGQLADLTGLTTGAITGMLNRLEEAGLVRRERDPNDGRKVIVQLEKDRDAMHKIGPVFASVGNAWDAIVADYDDEQLAFLLEFLKRSNAMSRNEIVRLRDAPSSDERIFSTPLGDLETGRVVISAGVSGLTLRADEKMADLYQARFEGAVPDVKAKEGVVTIRYPRRLWALDAKQRTAEVTLNATIPWRIAIQGGAADITAELGGLNLADLVVKGGLSSIRLELPEPSGVVPIRISGGASQIEIRRPAGIAARAHLKGWVSEFIFDDQTFSTIGNNVWLHSPGYEAAVGRYDIEVESSASTVIISTI